jgi:hypothetical protein
MILDRFRVTGQVAVVDGGIERPNLDRGLPDL